MINKIMQLEWQHKEKERNVETTKKENDERAKLEKAMESKLVGGTGTKEDIEL